MNLLDFLKRLSPDECREVGELFVFAADCPRNAAFHAHIEAAAAKFRDPKEDNLVAHVEAARERIRRLEEPLNRDGLNHRRLIEEELARRGDSRPRWPAGGRRLARRQSTTGRASPAWPALWYRWWNP